MAKAGKRKWVSRLDDQDLLSLDALLEELEVSEGACSVNQDLEDMSEFLERLDEPKSMAARPPDDMALMPGVLARSLNSSPTAGWTYNPRSDRHSKIKCWGLLLDLLRASPTLAAGMLSQEFVFGINSIVDGKALDLVIGRPGVWLGKKRPLTFEEHVEEYDIALSPEDRSAMSLFAPIPSGTICEPLLAVEAKAIMTDHGGAMPTLSDQLERFRHRMRASTITVGLVMVNTSDRFVSPGRNGYDATRTDVITSTHRQPHDADRVVSMLEGLPIRTSDKQGFDALGMVFVDCSNDDRPMSLPQFGPPELEYGGLIRRVSALCEARLAS